MEAAAEDNRPISAIDHHPFPVACVLLCLHIDSRQRQIDSKLGTSNWRTANAHERIKGAKDAIN